MASTEDLIKDARIDWMDLHGRTFTCWVGYDYDAQSGKQYVVVSIYDVITKEAFVVHSGFVEEEA